MKHVLWIAQVTIYFIWILPAFHPNYLTPQSVENVDPQPVPDSTSISSQDTTSNEVEFESEGQYDIANL